MCDEKCCCIYDFRGQIFKAYQLISGVQFNQWRVLLVAQTSTNQTSMIAIVPEIITLIVLSTYKFVFRLCVYVR